MSSEPLESQTGPHIAARAPAGGRARRVMGASITRGGVGGREAGAPPGEQLLGAGLCAPRSGQDSRRQLRGPGFQAQPVPLGPGRIGSHSQPAPIARSCHGDPLPPSATAFPVKPLQKSILPDRHAPGPPPPTPAVWEQLGVNPPLTGTCCLGESGERERTVGAWHGEEKVGGGSACCPVPQDPRRGLEQLEEVGGDLGS